MATVFATDLRLRPAAEGKKNEQLLEEATATDRTLNDEKCSTSSMPPVPPSDECVFRILDYYTSLSNS